MEGPANGQEPVAIVGMAVRFPGADDVHSLWDALKDGLNTATEVRFIHLNGPFIPN